MKQIDNIFLLVEERKKKGQEIEETFFVEVSFGQVASYKTYLVLAFFYPYAIQSENSNGKFPLCPLQPYNLN